MVVLDSAFLMAASPSVMAQVIFEALVGICLIAGRCKAFCQFQKLDSFWTSTESGRWFVNCST